MSFFLLLNFYFFSTPPLLVLGALGSVEPMMIVCVFYRRRLPYYQLFHLFVECFNLEIVFVDGQGLSKQGVPSCGQEQELRKGAVYGRRTE